MNLFGFEKGDIVRLKNGKSPLMVMDVGCSLARPRVSVCYLSTPRRDRDICAKWRDAEDFVLIEKAQPTKEVKEEMPKLYQVKNTEPAEFGTLLATNSTGKLVLEMKGSGQPKVFEPDDVEEVKPYTISITVAVKQGGLPGEGTLHYRSKPGALSEGDFVLFTNGAIGRVVKLDTKKDDAGSLKNVRKLVTEVLDDSPTLPGDNE